MIQLKEEKMTTKTKTIEGYGTVLGFIAFNDDSWIVSDTNGDFVKRITDERDDSDCATEEDVLTLAREVYPSASRIFDADMMKDAGVIETGEGYAILERRQDETAMARLQK